MASKYLEKKESKIWTIYLNVLMLYSTPKKLNSTWLKVFKLYQKRIHLPSGTETMALSPATGIKEGFKGRYNIVVSRRATTKKYL